MTETGLGYAKRSVTYVQLVKHPLPLLQSFQFAGLLIFIPGIYATVILVKYVLCHPDFSWKMLPEPQ